MFKHAALSLVAALSSETMIFFVSMYSTNRRNLWAWLSFVGRNTAIEVAGWKFERTRQLKVLRMILPIPAVASYRGWR
jgi:hypothetical protein